MSKSSFAERNKAVRAAWNKERKLVQEGKGTREWTPEQQKDILEKGRAYDDNGKAFEGQHMKSAEKYPEYQGNPGNIQFLTRGEHLEAHDGNWQNPSNWYFNPVTKEKIDFGDEPFIPCDVIQLQEPVVSVVENNSSCQKENTEDTVQSDVAQDIQSHDSVADNKAPKRTKASIPHKSQVPKKANSKFINGLKTVGKFTVEHPVESLKIAGMVIEGTVKAVSAIRGNRSGSTQKSSVPTDLSSTRSSSIVKKVADIVEKASRAENDVSGHKQRYNTKNGVIWKDKAPYHRGGNSN